ncbi:DUF2163 domain-containing protein [Parvibaculum sedimenti]|uniref:DUF2163 domain-containing protein n=1 Tax=Parvibaculum sedimenti TaxID=2608632 RepID=A0A6N6VKS7_9HYPH|nr:DUF2163 domain-containing protein [Parvibaculum sedimenti]KAB7741591.1 DUF2163 domain-containing protein [Parvibaculum sedimenti]
MKFLSSELAAHLAGGATTLCNCWKLTRGDGRVMGFTDHDGDLAFGGVTYEAAAGFTASAIESSAGLAVDNLDLAGALDSERLDEGDLAAGIYDDASVEIWRVNWQAPEQRVLMRKGNLGQVSRGATGFTAELRGLAHRLNQPVGRLFQYGCDADLGDERCGVALASVEMRGEGVVLSIEENRIVTASGLGAFDEGWFERGRLVFTSGGNTGAGCEVKLHSLTVDGAVIELWQAMAREIAPGDAFAVTAGCDKQFVTCRAKFGNETNFRGFPHMPGNDYVISYASSGDVNDGGSRN